MFTRSIVLSLVALSLFSCVVLGATTTASTTTDTTAPSTATATTGGPDILVTVNITITAIITYTPDNSSVIIDDDAIATQVANRSLVPRDDVNVTSHAYDPAETDPGNITVIVYFRNSTDIPERTGSNDAQTQVNILAGNVSTIINSEANNWGVFFNSTNVNGTYVTEVEPSTTTGHSLTSGASTHLATGSLSSTTANSTHHSTTSPAPKSAHPTSFFVVVSGIVGLLLFW